jgi:hypothetical protein
MRISHLKVAVWALVIFELWLLLQVPAVGESLFDFIIGGEVPGTTKVLSPTEMIYFLIGVFVLAAGLIFKKEIVELINRYLTRHSNRQVESADMPQVVQARPAAAVSRPKRVAAVKASQFIQKQRAASLLLLVRARTDNRFRSVGQYVRQQLWPRVAAALIVVRQKLQQLGAQLQKGAVWLLAMTAYLSYRLWVIVSTRSMQLWRWARPYMERCDRWLEYKLRQNDFTAAALDFGSEIAATVRKWVVRLRSFR